MLCSLLRLAYCLWTGVGRGLSLVRTWESDVHVNCMSYSALNFICSDHKDWSSRLWFMISHKCISGLWVKWSSQLVWIMHVVYRWVRCAFCNNFLLPFINPKASEEASLRALESLMTEFFHSCTTNERKREIGKFDLLNLSSDPIIFSGLCFYQLRYNSRFIHREVDFWI